MLKSYVSLILLFFSIQFTFGQTLNTQNTLTPFEIVQNVLVGQGIVVSNVTYNSSAPNSNVVQGNTLTFNSGTSPFPFTGGALLRTNGGTGNVSSDPDLNMLATNTVTNGVVLEFDFIPSGDTLSFKYMFASSEYPTYVCSSFNDVFGFFISGPGISGPFQNNAANIALIPNTTVPVSINTVNPGVPGGAGVASTCSAQDPNWTANSVYYTTAYAGYTNYDANGGTVVLTASASLICGQTYHIKIAISNVGDTALDSGVFLEADSFNSSVVDIAVATVSGDTSVVEGCTTADIIFSRPANNINDTLQVFYTLTGSATPGTDFANIPNPVVFLPGVDTIVLTINPTQDGLNDSPESVIITANIINDCGDTIVVSGTLYIFDGPIININELDPITYCANDSVLSTVSASGGYAPYTYNWSFGGQTGGTAYLPINQNGTIDYYVTATDACGFSNIDTVTVTMNQTLAIDTMIAYMASACLPDGAVSGTGIGITGIPLYHWEGPNSGGPSQINASVMQNLGAGWYVFSITDNVCYVEDSIFLTSAPAPIADFTASATSGCNPLDVIFTNNSQNSQNFVWDFGNGNSNVPTDQSNQSQTYTNNATVQLIAINGPCRDTTYETITIVNCGCTDPIASNFDPTAQVNDGSCVYPVPTVEVPNVFTPNGDPNNPLFTLTTTNATEVYLKVVNRWGGLMYEAKGLNVGWDGKIDGKLAADGVYFYEYIVTGVQGDKITGNGFVQLFGN